jgi:hypothetical protein
LLRCPASRQSLLSAELILLSLAPWPAGVHEGAETSAAGPQWAQLVGRRLASWRARSPSGRTARPRRKSKLKYEARHDWRHREACLTLASLLCPPPPQSWPLHLARWTQRLRCIRRFGPALRGASCCCQTRLADKAMSEQEEARSALRRASSCIASRGIAARATATQRQRRSAAASETRAFLLRRLCRARGDEAPDADGVKTQNAHARRSPGVSARRR